MQFLYSLLLLLTIAVYNCHSSAGDASEVFRQCAKKCLFTTCNMSDVAYTKQMPIYRRWLMWNCVDDCKYKCMWETVKSFDVEDLPVPQFYGKWPFVRVLGVQEPASAAFSVLNGAAHAVMLRRLRQLVPPPAAGSAMYRVWHAYAGCALVAWTASTIFHTRDFPLTEALDYLGALVLIFFSVFMLFFRCCLARRFLRWLAALPIIAYFVHHTNYMFNSFRIDYGYNMEVMVLAGVVWTVGWLWFCAHNWRACPHVRKMLVCVVTMDLFSVLELLDFAPIGWVIDSHALWHLFTVICVYFYYSFGIEDLLYLTAVLPQQKLKTQ